MRPKDNSTAFNIIHRKIQALSLHHAFSIYSFIVIGRSVEICIDELSAFDLDSPIYFGYSVIFCGTHQDIRQPDMSYTHHHKQSGKAGSHSLYLVSLCRHCLPDEGTP